MNLDYKVLWFDDQPDKNRGIEDNLRDRLAREGFRLVVRKISNFREEVVGRLQELRKEDDWDLILVDWDLGNALEVDGVKLDGAKLAKKVRNVFPYADLIFYSAEAPKKLRELIFNEDVDGVRCSSRGKALSAAIWGVVMTGIRKVIDLNHMRGIVMAAVADLDQAIDECLRKLHERMPAAQRKKLIGTIVERIKLVAESNARQMEKLVEKGFDELIEHRSFSTSLKHVVLMQTMKELGEELAAQMVLERLATYDSDVVHPRNAFAHVRATKKNGKVVLEGRDLVIDDRVMADIRRQLLCHKENLGDLLQLLAGWESSSVMEKVEAAIEEAAEKVEADEKAGR